VQCEVVAAAAVKQEQAAHTSPGLEVGNTLPDFQSYGAAHAAVAAAAAAGTDIVGHGFHFEGAGAAAAAAVAVAE